MPQLDVSTFLSQLFWLALSFGFLYLLLSKVCIPSIEKIFIMRDAKISNSLAAAHRAKEEAEKIRSNYEQALAKAATAKNNIIAELSKEMSLVSESKLAELSAEIKAMHLQAEEKLKEFEKSAEEEIIKIAKEASFYILNNVVDIKITEEELDLAIKEVRKEQKYAV